MDLWRPRGGASRLTRRKLRVFIRGLPVDSATRIALNGGRPPFAPVQYQIADLHDVLSMANWQRANDGIKPGKQSAKPPRYPRPEDIRIAEDRRTDRQRKLEALRERMAKRRELIASGRIA